MSSYNDIKSPILYGRYGHQKYSIASYGGKRKRGRGPANYPEPSVLSVISSPVKHAVGTAGKVLRKLAKKAIKYVGKLIHGKLSGGRKRQRRYRKRY